MKKHTKFVTVIAISTSSLVPTSFAQLSVPSDGSDGALNITSNTVVDLSQAVTGTWGNTSSGNGIYDPTNWAVVFKYSSVNIASGATVTFANHYANPPVIWLVQSNVTINGTISINGNGGTQSVPGQYLLTEPGPGGFRGGAVNTSIGYGDGLGPGGGIFNYGNVNSSGIFNGTYQNSYGNSEILPLIGGSGASSTYGDWSGQIASGASGAGAILIVSSGTVTVNGQITATPGYDTLNQNEGSENGAGGAVRIVANQIAGSGSINAAPQGRIRMEANSMSQQLNIVPNTALVSPGTTPVIFPTTGSPTVSIVSIGGQTAPSDPHANVISSPDITFATNAASPITVVLQTQNFPTTGIVSVRVVPIYTNSWSTNATLASGNAALATWQVTAPIPLGYCVLQAHATSP